MNDQTAVNTLSDDATASEIIIHSIMNAVAYRAQNSKDDSEDIQRFPSMIKKKNVFVQHKQDDYVVEYSNELIELVKDSPEIVHESYYYGGDSSKVYVLKVLLSDSYIARVSNIMLQDIPDEYFDRAFGKFRRDGVVVRNFKSRFGKEPIKKMLCVDLEPIWTDREINEKPQETYAKYHCITVKIDREDMRFLGWVPGIDTQSNPCSSLGEMFVSLGDRDMTMDPDKGHDNRHQQQHPPKKLTFGSLRK